MSQKKKKHLHFFHLSRMIYWFNQQVCSWEPVFSVRQVPATLFGKTQKCTSGLKDNWDSSCISQKKSTSLGDVAKVLKHFHSLNNQSNIWWWVTGFCIFRSDYVDSNYSIGHVSLWIFKVCVLQNTKTVTLFSQFNCIKNTGCKFREFRKFCINCTFLNVSHDLQNYSTVFVRVVKSTGFCTEI